MLKKKRLTNKELIEQAAGYKTFKNLLHNNRKLYYTIKNKGLSLDGVLTRERRRVFTVNVLKLEKLILTMRGYNDDYTAWTNNHQSEYIVLRRHGFDTYEIFENLDDKEYLLSVLKAHSDDMLVRILEDKE